MNALYPELAQIALDLLHEFGQAVQVIKKGSPVYDAHTDTYRETETVLNGFAAGFAYTQAETDGHLIEQNNIKIYLNRIAAPPEIADEIVLNGKRWRIKNVSPLSPAGFDVIYVLQAA